MRSERKSEQPRSTDPEEILRLPFPINRAESEIVLASIREALTGDVRATGAEQAVDLGNGLVRGEDGMLYRAGS